MFLLNLKDNRPGQAYTGRNRHIHSLGKTMKVHVPSAKRETKWWNDGSTYHLASCKVSSWLPQSEDKALSSLDSKQGNSPVFQSFFGSAGFDLSRWNLTTIQVILSALPRVKAVSVSFLAAASGSSSLVASDTASCDTVTVIVYLEFLSDIRLLFTSPEKMFLGQL